MGTPREKCINERLSIGNQQSGEHIIFGPLLQICYLDVRVYMCFHFFLPHNTYLLRYSLCFQNCHDQTSELRVAYGETEGRGNARDDVVLTFCLIKHRQM